MLYDEVHRLTKTSGTRLFRGGQATSDVSVNREAEETQSVQPQNDDPEPSEGGEDLDNAEEDLLG